ncbi:hypothetical protein BDN67DRAFT_415276 [Paxillus ammoniavirescens]|nr:hypothetical protein BDN67DRAFT_415276 [Paxillus ammoniavirescens]
MGSSPVRARCSHGVDVSTSSKAGTQLVQKDRHCIASTPHRGRRRSGERLANAISRCNRGGERLRNLGAFVPPGSNFDTVSSAPGLGCGRRLGKVLTGKKPKRGCHAKEEAADDRPSS